MTPGLKMFQNPICTSRLGYMEAWTCAYPAVRNLGEQGTWSDIQWVYGRLSSSGTKEEAVGMGCPA